MARPSYDRAYYSFIGVVRDMKKKGLPCDENLVHRIIEARKSAA
jgi:hypothetical protein